MAELAALLAIKLRTRNDNILGKHKECGNQELEAQKWRCRGYGEESNKSESSTHKSVL